MPRKPDLDGIALEHLLDRAFGRQEPVSFELTADGVSAQVYRLFRGSDVFYLRAAEEENERLTVDAELFRHLRGLGVRVPEVIYLEPFDPLLRRSIMIMTAVPGVSLAWAPSLQAAAAVARCAGRDLALLNRIPVSGFGFVRRDGSAWPLAAEYSSYATFVSSFLPDNWPGSLSALFNPSELALLENLIEAEEHRPLTAAQLAHGDLDVTPIFHVDGCYTGLIDFGEIRGTEPSFDLGHFLLHDRETYPAPLFDHLVVGYQDVESLPSSYVDDVLRSGILLGLRQLCRWIGPRQVSLTDRRVRQRAARLSELLRRTRR